MKVLNLRCAADHGFEGWFASEDDFAAQAASAGIACPLCGSTEISRLPSAPRLNVGHHAEPDAGPAQAVQMTLQSQWLKVVRQVMSSTEDVGDRFAEELGGFTMARSRTRHPRPGLERGCPGAARGGRRRGGAALARPP